MSNKILVTFVLHHPFSPFSIKHKHDNIYVKQIYKSNQANAILCFKNVTSEQQLNPVVQHKIRMFFDLIALIIKKNRTLIIIN